MKSIIAIVLVISYSLLGAEELPGWPVSLSPAEGVFLSSPLALDLDGDGTKEIVVAGPDDSLRAFRTDGSALSGFPVALSGDVSTQIAAGPVTGSWFQLVVLTTNGTIHVFDQSGNIVSPFPITLADSAGVAGPVLWDFDGDGSAEIVAQVGDSLHVIMNDGSETSGFPVPVLSDYGPAASPAVGDFTGNGDAEIVAVGYDKLYAYDHTGTILPSFPIELADSEAFSYSAPILLDFDGDDTLDICACYHSYGGSNHGYIATWNIHGEMVDSWPISAADYGSWIYGSPAAGDIDGDGLPEISVTSHNGRGYVVNSDASSPDPWSMALGIGAMESSPLLCDFNGDGGPDILFLGNDSTGTVACYDAVGASIDSFPWNGGASWRLATPIIDDIDDDGDLDICAIDEGGTMHLFDYYQTGAAYSRPWTMGRHDPLRTGWLHPEPPDTVIAHPFADSVIVSWARIIDWDLDGYNLYATADSSDSSGGEFIEKYSDTVAVIALDSTLRYFFVTGTTHFTEGKRSMIAAIDSTTNIADAKVPQRIAIKVYPNPFNAICTIETPNDIEIFDMSGRLIAKKTLEPNGIVRWNGTDNHGQALPSGIYLIKTKKGFESKKVVLLR